MSGQNIYPVHNALHLLAAPHSITQMLQFDHDERKSFGWKFVLTLNFQTQSKKICFINMILHCCFFFKSHIYIKSPSTSHLSILRLSSFCF